MLDFESVCRCCLQINDLSDLFEFTSEIAVDEQNYEKIHEIYEKILFTKICLDDPSKVCAICLQELKNAFVFQQKSMESNKIYMQELEIFKEIQLTSKFTTFFKNSFNTFHLF